MEVVDGTATAASGSMPEPGTEGNEQVRVRRKTLKAVLEQCQMTLELIQRAGKDVDLGEGDGDGEEDSEGSSVGDFETDELCDLLKSKVESPNFLEKLGSIHMSMYKNSSDDTASWDVVSAKDLWDDKHINGDTESGQDDFVLVKQEDIVEGIACFMAAYLLSLKETKELSPDQLQEALTKTFSLKKKKSKLRKAWDGSKVIYNVASWGATAVGIYQNPAIIRAATVAFWSSCRVISKLF
ncbi:uncharacterized protein LOC120263926 [Dioscorea cayenensis subsp. rotundata]|uniref:Uncharacterized protein LOC120263926 n=1 Tax=Dioscorea cayennensis subsp. rotundata TaxID=55577 RepID=A0AB40BKB5_DIOCR|nr:uncharacterized protein LOC120263926 [Dioscorea cayenensis subsp. rotundata]